MNDLSISPQDTATDESINTTQPQLDSLINLEAAIKEKIEKIEDLKNEMQPVREMLASYLENDPVYREHDKAAKDASKQKSATKKQLLSVPAGASIVEKLDTMKEEMRELQDGLSDNLREFQTTTGSSEIEGADGELRQIVYIAKLVRKTNLNR